MPESGSALGLENNPKPYAFEDIFQRFKIYIEREKPGLKRFYKPDEPDQHFKDLVTRGLVMTQQLMDDGCPHEESAALSLLALYDLVILIGNSHSMGIDQDGAQVETLSDTLRAASVVHSFAEKGGITAVRFSNTSNQYFNVIPGKITALMKGIVFEGLADIGAELRDKVLVNHVTPDMKKPLLVVVIIDDKIGGEATGLLKDVIKSQVVGLKERYGDHGPQAVAYQFANIGSGKAAKDLVEGLKNDKVLGPYVSYLGVEFRLKDIVDDMWEILPKLLLGAISDFWRTEVANSHLTLQHRDDELKAPSSDDEGDLTDELEYELLP